MAPTTSPPSHPKGVYQQGTGVVFDLIAEFLEVCQFKSAAAAVRSQCSEREPFLDAEFKNSFKDFVGSASSLLSEIESGTAGKKAARKFDHEEALDQLVEGLIQQLLSVGHRLSDDQLNSSIEGVLTTDVFSKLAVAQRHLDKRLVDKRLGDCSNLPDISDAEVSAFWDAVTSEPRPAAAVGAAPGGGAGDAAAAEAPAAPLPPAAPAAAASAHYRTRRPRGARGEEGAEGAEGAEGTEGAEGVEERERERDEYHDDDDPGYRIREIYEAELLAELNQRMAVGGTPAQVAGEGEVPTDLASPASAARAEVARCPSGRRGSMGSGRRGSRSKGPLGGFCCHASWRALFLPGLLLCALLLCLPTLRSTVRWGHEAPSGPPARGGLQAAPPELPGGPADGRRALPAAVPARTLGGPRREGASQAQSARGAPAWAFCAARGEDCSCPGRVRWGSRGEWLEYGRDETAAGNIIRCGMDRLPDLLPGDADKHCECLRAPGNGTEKRKVVDTPAAAEPQGQTMGGREPAGGAGAGPTPPGPEWVFCASQWQQCVCHGRVRWGNAGRWHEVAPRAGESTVAVACSVARLPDVAPGDDGKHCQCLGRPVVPGLPDEADADTAEPLVSCRGHGWGGGTAWEAKLREAMAPLCAEAPLRPYMEVFLDRRFRGHFARVYGDDGWCEEAWVNFAAPRGARGERVSGYAQGLRDQMVDSVHRYSSKPVIVVSFGAKAIPHLDPERHPRMVLLHARMKEGLSFSFSALRAALLSRVKVGVNIEEDMLFVSPQADTLFARSREEIFELYPFPMLPTHFLDRDPANERRRFGNFLKFTVPGGRDDPPFPRPTLRWGQAQASWTSAALPFLGRWLAARLLGREEQGVPTRGLGEAEDLLNVGLWRENASKAWCLWQTVGADVVWNNFLPQRAPGPPGLNSDPSRFPHGVPIAFYWAWAEGQLPKYDRAFKELDRLKSSGAPLPKTYWHAGKFYDTFSELQREHPRVGCLL